MLVIKFLFDLVENVMRMTIQLAMTHIPNHAVFGRILAWTHPQPVVGCFDNRQFVSGIVYYGNKVNEVSSLQDAEVVNIINVQVNVFS